MSLNACDMCRICTTTSKLKSVRTFELNWIGFSILIPKLAGLYVLDSFFILTQPLSSCVRSSLLVSLISPTSCYRFFDSTYIITGGRGNIFCLLVPSCFIFFWSSCLFIYYFFGQVVCVFWMSTTSNASQKWALALMGSNRVLAIGVL